MKMKQFIIVLALMWVSNSYFTINDLVAKLNTLPVERQLEAKIIVVSNQPSWFGSYYLIYRQDNDMTAGSRVNELPKPRPLQKGGPSA